MGGGEEPTKRFEGNRKINGGRHPGKPTINVATNVVTTSSTTAGVSIEVSNLTASWKTQLRANREIGDEGSGRLIGSIFAILQVVWRNVL